AEPDAVVPVEEAPEEEPAPRRRTRSRKAAPVAAEEAPLAPAEATEAAPPKRRSRARKAEPVEAAPEAAPEASVAEEAPKPAKRPRRSRSGAAVAGQAEVPLPVAANPDDEVEAGLALDDEPAIDVPFPPGNAPATPED
ncbi:hypothetical protein QUT57_22820, partial [Xanthomonas citri pv. citri]